MKWKNFKPYFHESWHNKIQPFIESKECDDIYKFLKFESRRGKQIVPLSYNVFRCFLETPLNEMKVILMGMSPYHTMRRGTMIADGLLMGCSNSDVLQPSLQQFYDGIERELYNELCIHAIKGPDVSYLAKQGVLMFNASLTTELNKAGSHLQLWEPFIKYIFENVFAYSGVPIVFLGKEAAKYEKYCAPFSWVFSVSHPASASYTNTEWDSQGVFGKINKILKDNNNFKIEWLEQLPF